MKTSTAIQQLPRDRRWLLSATVYTVIASAAWYCIFRLPFSAPPSGPRIRSTSYAVGFNNRVAIASVLVLIAALTVRALRRRSAAVWVSTAAPARISRTVIVTMVVAYSVITAAIYVIARSAEWYGLEWESSHFLWRMKLTTTYGLQPYSGYQFEYGPMLAYIGLGIYSFLKPVGVTQEASYYLSHLVLNVAGLLSIAFVLQRVAMPARTREIAFIALGAAGFLPNMGLNGILLRYTAPFFSLVLLHQSAKASDHGQPGRVFLAALSGLALCIALSSEIGIAFLVVLIVYAVCSVSRRGVVWPVMAAMAVTVAVAPTLLPVRYFASLGHFSQGGNNLPLLPTSPHLLLYLCTMIWIIPKWLAGIAEGTEDGVLTCALGVVTLVLLPGALGRCDPYHVLFYGIGASLLAFIYLSNVQITVLRAYTAVYVLVFFFGLELINAWVFGLTPRGVAKWAIGQWSGVSSTNVDLRPLQKYQQLALPYGSYGYSKPVQQWLWAQHKIAPEYYMGGMGIYTEDQMAERRNDLGRFRNALVHDAYREIHKQSAHEPCVPDWQYLRKALLYPWRLRCVQPSLDPDGEISRFLESDYHPVEKVGDYVVLEKNH